MNKDLINPAAVITAALLPDSTDHTEDQIAELFRRSVRALQKGIAAVDAEDKAARKPMKIDSKALAKKLP